MAPFVLRDKLLFVAITGIQLQFSSSSNLLLCDSNMDRFVVVTHLPLVILILPCLLYFFQSVNSNLVQNNK